MLKIIHGADFHLDSPFAGLSPEGAAQRRREQRELLDALARLAGEKQANLVLLAGDLFDSERVYPETRRALCAALGTVPCPVFISPGNHDYYTAAWQAVQWPDNVHIFSSGTLERVDLPGCTLWGRAFTAPHETVCPLDGLAVPDDGTLHLACLHGEVGPAGSYGPIPPEAIANSGLDYLALGHIHQYSGLQTAGKTAWAYPGCPLGRGFDEQGEKGVLYVEAEPGRVSAQFIPLAKRRYEILSAGLTGAENPLDAIRAVLPEDPGQVIARLVLTGECQPPNLPALERELAPLFCGLTLIDRTRLPQDLWARRGEDSLTGLFLQAMWEACQDRPDDPLLQLAARYGLAALVGGEEAVL